MKVIAIMVSLLSLCILTYSQELTPDEFVALGRKKLAGIDSAMTAKGFVKEDRSKDVGFPLFTYTYITGTGKSTVQRSLHVGLRLPVNVLSLQYGVWQKDEASNSETPFYVFLIDIEHYKP